MYTRSLSLSFFNLFLFLVCICSNTLQVLSNPEDDEVCLNIWMTNFWKYGALYPCSLYYSSSYYFHIKIREKKNNFNSFIVSCFPFITFWLITSMTSPITSCLLQKFFFLFIILETWIQPISCWMTVFLWLFILMFLYDMCIRLV